MIPKPWKNLILNKENNSFYMIRIKSCILSVFVFFSFACLNSQSLDSLRGKISSSRTSYDSKSQASNQKSSETTKFSSLIKDSESTAALSTEEIDTTKVPNAQVAMSVSYYPVTAGDVYTLGFVIGSTPVSYTIPVDSTYKIRIANMGVINCTGLTYLQLKSQVEALVLRNYPMGGVQFVLTAPSLFLVTLTGEVKQTVDRNAWALTRLSTLIKDSLTPYSSTRSVTIERADGTSETYDLFLSVRKGQLAQDPFLRPGDKIVVNRAKRIVRIDGAVERPGTYELLDGDNLKELIEIYGNGLEPLADTSRIELTRNVSDESVSGKKTYLDKSAIDSNFELKDFDFVTIESYADLTPVIYLEGAINKTVDAELEAASKITVPFVSGEDYAFFARRNKELFTAISDLANAYIIRNEQVIQVNLTPMLYDSSYYTKIEMQAGDTLVIPFKQFFISVAGAVANPGRYPYIPDRTWEYYIGLAGGFDKSRNTFEAISIRDRNGKKLSKNDVITPESTITASTNSGLYYFNQYAPIITTTLTAIISVITVKTYLDSKK